MKDTRVLVLLPVESVDEGLAAPDACELVPWRTHDDIVRALHGEFDAAVLVTDGLTEAGVASVIAAIRERGKPVVEVRLEQWDGFSPMPLAAACKGVISGFGLAGAWAAVEALRG